MAAPTSGSDDLLASEPYFAVVPTAAHLRRNLTAAVKQAFFADGEALVAWMFRVMEPVVDRFSPVTVLEYGCGVGRLSLALARYAGTVTAVDRASAVLEEARALCAERGIGNVEFALTDEALATRRQFDLVVCFEPLQRLRPADGLALMTSLIARISPGGIGLFHLPYDDGVPLAIRALRAVRERVPGVNRLLNRVRGAAADDPFVPTHVYPLDQTLKLLRSTSMGAAHVVLNQQSDTDRATVLVWMPFTPEAERLTRIPDVADVTAPEAQSAPIDVRALIARTSISELNRTAEHYFSTLTDWEHHLAKPFAKLEDVPPLLQDVAGILQGLRLQEGMTVLEYGAGSGWLSRYLTQLGCHAVLLDVAPTALRMAGELYARQPVIGTRPEPRFLLFDGRHIDLPDHSVDRIVCYHAFHHAPNPDEVLAEFGRVLKPGGIAGFAEPGPRHSLSPLSQFEMRTYGVVENDVDVHAIWWSARARGFADIRIAVFHAPAHHVSLAEFENLLHGGPAGDRWLASTRQFLSNVRTFFLIKDGNRVQDSRTSDGLACAVTANIGRSSVAAGASLVVDASVTNTGTATWLPWPGRGGVALGFHLYDRSGALLNFDLCCAPLTEPPRTIAPGETVELQVSMPPLSAGQFRVEVDCVASGVTWFAQLGSATVTIDINVT